MTPRLIVRADDFGACRAFNRGIAQAHRRGVVTAAEIIVPGAAFQEARALARRLPRLDLGVHLAFFSEWRAPRWRPLLPAPQVRSLVDAQGFFVPGPAAWKRRVVWREVEREGDAQIRSLRRDGVRVSHVSWHWTQPLGAPPAFLRLVRRLAGRWGLAVSGLDGEAQVDVDLLDPASPPIKRAALFLQQFVAPTQLMVVHPAAAGAELAGLRLRWPSKYDPAHRARELAWLTHPGTRRFLKDQGVRLAGYRGPAS